MNAVGEMTCQELVELVTAHFDGALPPCQAARFEEHLAACPACVIYLAQLRETIRLTRQRLGEESLPRGMREQLLGHFRDWKKGRNDPLG
jgi:anti-sigma factor RsiW